MKFLKFFLRDGMLGKSELICKEILGDKYMRIDPILEKEIPMVFFYKIY